MPQITFHGAAETVSGSKYLVEVDGTRVLVDCGLFQGLKPLRLKNWEELPFRPSQLDAIVLTHAHIDHIGLLPRVVKLGYKGPVWCTPATADLAEVLLFDSAQNQEADAEYANRKGFSKHHPALPLYEARDVSRTLKLLQTAPRGEWFNPAGPVFCRYHDAGHLLGSAQVEMELRRGDAPLRLLFSGDVGRYRAPLYHDPAPPPECDYLICESTYGNRDHPAESIFDQLAAVVDETIRRGGIMLVASFAVGRAQQLIYLLRVLTMQGRIPELPIFLDSPMAISATHIYTDHAADHDLSELQLAGSENVLSARSVHLARTEAESKRINSVRGPAVVIASSGMMIGGRILHHLKQRLPDEQNIVVLGGFASEGTRARSLKDGAPFIRIHGRDVPVRAQVRELPSLSGHADRSELRRWLEPLRPPRQVFITHGEKQSADDFAEQLRSARGWNVTVPRLGETFELEPPA
jgi:metallo-beta-lactamase family protein